MGIYFIQKFFQIIEDPDAMLFVIDEVGFGRKSLRHYAYSPIGEPAILERGKMLNYNLTCTATISTKQVELIKFFS